MITFANIPKNNDAVIAFGFKEIGPYYWVGTCKNGINYYAGQTFQAPATGLLTRIQLFSSIVYGPSDVTLSIYQFDHFAKVFSHILSEQTLHITKANESQWIDFVLANVDVDKDEHYAFKITCSGAGMLAIAECPWNIPDPYDGGVQWTGSSLSKEGSFNVDFDFAFIGEIEASPNAKFI